ncbi:putative viral A-type inclusion protein [Toxoplasma gondii VEG]|uniref:Putative viral A-type inclusion protein n=1 Tax=Toxoplasma gondii (strain ATCC 50861 / VEG) TaxID=432359 RepID=B9QJR6_TOXGV|nr:putative viral A-type inclusion protein [Toxoplasma gondii VEG]CEL73228.1 TPA: viral A-type inclusion protein repeat family [Toxoplasma gondii VEG]
MHPHLSSAEPQEPSGDVSPTASSQLGSPARSTVVDRGDVDLPSHLLSRDSFATSVAVSRVPEEPCAGTTAQRFDSSESEYPPPVSIFPQKYAADVSLVPGTAKAEGQESEGAQATALLQEPPSEDSPSLESKPLGASSFHRDTDNQPDPCAAPRESTVVTECRPEILVTSERESAVSLQRPPQDVGTEKPTTDGLPPSRSPLPGKSVANVAVRVSAHPVTRSVVEVPVRESDLRPKVAASRPAPQVAPWRVDQETEAYPREEVSSDDELRAGAPAQPSLVTRSALPGMPSQPLARQPCPDPGAGIALAQAGFEPVLGAAGAPALRRSEPSVTGAVRNQAASSPPETELVPSGNRDNIAAPPGTRVAARHSEEVKSSPAEITEDTQFPSSAPPSFLGAPKGRSSFGGHRNCVRAPYVVEREAAPVGTYYGAHRVCVIGPQRASPARRTSWWVVSNGEEPQRPLSMYWKERAKRWKCYNDTASQEAALRTRPPPGTEQKVTVVSRRPSPDLLAPSAGSAATVQRVETSPSARATSPGMHLVLSPQQRQEPDESLQALAEARDAIQELERTLAEQEVRWRGDNMLKEGCIAYQDESIRLLKAQIKKLSEDLQCYATSNAFRRRETAALLRHLRVLRATRGARQGSIEGLQILYRKLEAARTMGIAAGSQTADYLTGNQSITPPSPVGASYGDTPTCPHAPALQAQQPTSPASPSSALQSPSPGEPLQSSFMVSPPAHVDQNATYSPRSPGAVGVSVSTSITGLPQPDAPAPRPELIDAETEMSEAGFDELLGEREERRRREEEEREEKRRREEEERQLLATEVKMLQQQLGILLEHEKQEEEKVRQQQGQLGLLQEQEKLLRAQAEEQESLQKQIVARLEAEAMDHALKERRREELRQLVQETTTPFPFAPNPSRRNRALLPELPRLDALPQSPLPRTSSPSPAPFVGVGQGLPSPTHSPRWKHRALDGEPLTLASPRGSSRSPTTLLLSKEDAQEREDLRRANEVLQKKCTELHGQVTYLQMAGAGLSREQLEYLEAQLAEQKEYTKALETQNKELVEMAEKALNDQKEAMEKEWGERLQAVADERDVTTEALKRQGETARSAVLELERKIGAAERTKDDALGRLVMSENKADGAEQARARAEERVRECEEEIESLRRKLSSLEQEVDAIRRDGGRRAEELQRQLEERERQVAFLEQSAGVAEQANTKLRNEVDTLKRQHSTTQCLMRSQVASLAEQMEKDQRVKEDVIAMLTSETEMLQAQAAEATANYKALEAKWTEQTERVATLETEKQALEAKWTEQQERVATLETEKKALETMWTEQKDRAATMEGEKKKLEASCERMKEESKRIQEEETRLIRAFSKTLPEGTSVTLEKILQEKEKQLEESRQRVSVLKKDLEESRNECAKALEGLEAEQKNRQAEEKKYKDELEKLRERERQSESTLQSYISGLQKVQDESMKSREQTERTMKENEEKYAKLSELTAKQHFEREKVLQKHLQEKDALKQSLARMVEETEELQKRYENELQHRDDGYRRELEDNQGRLQEMLKEANERADAANKKVKEANEKAKQALSERAALEKSFQAEMENMKKQHQTELTQIRESFQKEAEKSKKNLQLQRSLSIDGMKRRHQQELAALRADSQTALSAAKLEYESAAASHEEKLKAAIESVKKEYEEALLQETRENEKLKKQHTAEVEKLSQSQVGKIDQHRRQSEHVIEELKKRHAAELEEMKERLAKSTQDYTAMVQELRDKAAKALNDAQKAHLEEIEKLKSKSKEQEEAHRREIALSMQELQTERGLRGDHSDRFRELLHERITTLQHEIDSLTMKLEDVRDKSAVLESEKESLLKVNQELEREKQQMVEERRRTVDDTRRLEKQLVEVQACVSVHEAKATQLAKDLDGKEKKLLELRQEIEKGKSDSTRKEERLRKAVEAARLVKNEEMKQRDIINSLKKQLEAKEKTLSGLEDEVDHLQEMLRAKDQNDLETLSTLKRRSTELEFDLQDMKRENAQLKRARETLERERRRTTDVIHNLQEEVRRLAGTAKVNQEDPEKERLRGQLADLERQVEDLEFQLDEHAHAEATVRGEAKHFQEESMRKSEEIEKLKKDLSLTRAKVAEANQRMRQSLSDFKKQQEELRSRLARDFARKEEELMAKYQMSRTHEEEVRSREDDSRIRELEAMIGHLTAAPTALLSTAMIAEVKSFLRHAADTLLTVSAALGDGEAIGELITHMYPMLSAKEVSQFLLKLVPTTPVSVLESLVERLEPATEAREVWDKMQKATPLLRLSPEAAGLALSIRNHSQGVRSSGVPGSRAPGSVALALGRVNGSADTRQQILRFVEVSPPLESLHLLKCVGNVLDPSDVVSLLATLLPAAPHASVASVATALFHDDAPNQIGDALGQEFAEFLKEFTYAHHFAVLLPLTGDAIKQIRAIYAVTSNPSTDSRDTAVEAPVVPYGLQSVAAMHHRTPVMPQPAPVVPQPLPVTPPSDAFAASASAISPVLPQCYATPHAPYLSMYQPPPHSTPQRRRPDAPPAADLGRSVQTVESSRPPGPRMFNLNAKLSYKLVTQKKTGKKEKASEPVDAPIQRVVSDASTN